ncbi:PaaI family thioesterase [Thalassococcus sp. BH17M4-6]|uniref:PaaI family thioesterase n=1 Tax=Thalassococcus sp. BH17M4-6 TaxID=3413148 RepID=UPI003BE0E42A
MSDLDPRFAEPAYPFAAHLGMRMTGWRDGWARFEMALAPEIMNRHGNPHGGAHASLLDTVMGYAGCWTGDPEVRQMALTLSLNVQYLSRPRGTLLIGEGRQTGGGRSTFFAEATVVDDLGELIASGTGVFRYRKGGA